MEIAKGGGKVWGNAYVITTHGIPMGKFDYLTGHVLEQAERAVERLKWPSTCGAMAQALQEIEGIGPFLAGQIVADLKNTPGHPLHNAPDRDTFVIHGPGSLRGASWFHYNRPDKVTASSFDGHFREIRKYVDANLDIRVGKFDNQDLQNCLCEFDKYMRVRNGTGRSKRSYNGR